MSLRCWAVPLLLAVAIMRLAPAPARAGMEFPVCTWANDQMRPDISGYKVVWEHTQAINNRDIHGLDLLGGGWYEIATQSADQAYPAISGDTVVWEDYRGGVDTGWDIYGYDLVGGTEFSICTWEKYQTLPDISGSMVVWQHAYASNDGDIYGYDLAHHRLYEIATDYDDQEYPAIAGNTVVWQDLRNVATTSWDIYGYDLVSETQFPVCTDTSEQWSPSVWGDTVVWDDTPAPTAGDIWGRDLSSGGPFPICTEPSDDQVNAAVSGSIVVWEDYRNFFTTGADIYGYDLATDTEFAICTASGYQTNAAISGNIVVWQDTRSYAQTGYDIYGRGLPVASFAWSPAEPVDLDVVHFTDASTDHGGVIVSWSWDFGDGGTSAEQSPSHQFEVGTWTVCLTVTDNGTPPISMTHCETVMVAEHGCLVSCGGSACGGPGERSYWYELAAPSGTAFDWFAVGTHDPDLQNYGNWMLPLDWSVAGIFSDIGPAHGEFHPHGELSTPTGQCPYAIVFVGPPIETGVIAFDHPGEPHDVGWLLERTIEPTWGCLEDWASPVGLGRGPVHGPVPANEPPVCCFEYGPPWPQEGAAVEFFDCSGDPDGAVVAWEWDFGDGGTSTAQNPVHEFAAGTYRVSLTVTDDDGATSSCGQEILVSPPTVEVAIPLTEGWHMISLPLEPVNKTILVDRASGVEDPGSIFYSAWLQGNDPRMRLFRIEPGAGYWAYEPQLYPTDAWYEIGVEPPPGKPHPGPWWQGFWFLVEAPGGVTISYEAYPLPAGPAVRFLDIIGNYPPGTFEWAWMMIGACARMPVPYTPDVTAWPATSTANDMLWGTSAPPAEPVAWLPASLCTGPDAWDQAYIGLPMVGYLAGGGYYAVSPHQGEPLCGAPADTDGLRPGEGYWLDVESSEAWLRLLAGQWP